MVVLTATRCNRRNLRNRFGKGAVEGVIAPETANNSKEGGALLPTCISAFPAVPHGDSAAPFRHAGIQPGPRLATDQTGLVWTLIWTLAIANILAVLRLLVLAPWLSRIASLRTGLLVPFVIVLSLLAPIWGAGAGRISCWCSASARWAGVQDIGWPAPALRDRIVLGRSQTSFHKAMGIWGASFLLAPSRSSSWRSSSDHCPLSDARKAEGGVGMKVNGRIVTSLTMVVLFAFFVAQPSSSAMGRRDAAAGRLPGLVLSWRSSPSR